MCQNSVSPFKRWIIDAEYVLYFSHAHGTQIVVYYNFEKNIAIAY